ncbi:hypothetical protein A3I46_03375 [Candidatus Kaiserbacteria bacterium RIFCSPLOWO2_02_FULL_54_13]|uniref:Uncharacterized protein n=1 Tax=Candidatus Kaiserbacteria bacterium RIFCSPHIGHO2_02_FULL_54_22 TaxID=1798495 RepID=A0A1F6DMB5_9BACT|nr:MAG: hypothetical protein A3C19_01075 [Candidatus Kaiserbacteria bacterium RIFCSPHIGHO2_02_FULL_54_22]OGG67915.1 MAG: hypothetical protein A3E99_03030 [Candidatus Kaiserbacteria bacterium RIFCSPHIGHO2_12_FULL_54_16]OGG82511.1 MAG: hypothetical protein A3I46_03375 [Candidatus Kaiserbacteria bacterium RIFCSPLOWO2_02_FULL_54_13]OGG89817.1 MAG: hypothetical protein A3G12_01930 [Candidatus Kaiserbacteria bacterium RIFCSPLOWO2_12_FULL_54_10]
MAEKKIPVVVVVRLAEQIAMFGFPREKTIAALKAALEAIGAEVDLNPPASLDFGGKTDLERTQPFTRPRLEQPFQA